MDTSSDSHGLLAGARQVLVHGTITLLALAIAFSLPSAAQYVWLWWPRAETNADLLLMAEIALASALVLLFNLAKLAWDARHTAAVARLTAVVHAGSSGQGWLSRLRERRLLKRTAAARDACLLSRTGYSTLVDEGSAVRTLLASAYEIRVMLVNPLVVASFRAEIEASIAQLAKLRALGKRVTLKFCDEEPFWKVVVLGNHAWVQHCHLGCRLDEQPEYVFALQPGEPRRGLFLPFYMYFLERWSEREHPEYDFAANELVYRDSAGNEIRRTPLGGESAERGDERAQALDAPAVGAEVAPPQARG